MNKTSAKLAVARNIRFFRIKNRFSCRELAKRIGVCAASISAYETSRCLPSLDVMFRLACVLGTSVADLLGEPSTTKSEISLADALNMIIENGKQLSAIRVLLKSLGAQEAASVWKSPFSEKVASYRITPRTGGCEEIQRKEEKPE